MTIKTNSNSTVPAVGGNLQKDGNDHKGEIRHPLDDKDGKAIAAMRIEVAPFKGKMNGPDARAPFDEVMEQTPDAAGVTYERAIVGGVPGTRCRPENARPGVAILYLHGGAYVLGSAHAYRHLAGQIAARTNAATFIADYRLAPEHPFPAAVDDAKAAYQGLVEEGAQSIAVVGDSAGGGLALALLSLIQTAAQKGQGIAPSAGVVMSPWTDLALTSPSLGDRAEADPLLTRGMLATTAASYLDGHEPHDPLASPLYAALAGLPPIQLHVGSDEILLDDARRYAERARAEKVEAEVHVWDGMTHVFPSGVGKLTAAEQALEIMANFLKENLRTRSEAFRIHAYGGPEVLQVDDVSVPMLGAGQVLVRVNAAGVNGLDWKIRDGLLKEAFPVSLPATLGFELSGLVVQAGQGTSRLKVGDRVIGPLDAIGAYADFVAVDESKLSVTPDELTDTEAAALPVAALTAWQALHAAGELHPGQKVLIHGAAGAVGGFAVQFAKAAGATVLATASASSADYVLGLGADVVIDYKTERFEDRAEGIDLVLDLVGGETLERSWHVLAPGGAIVSTTQPDLAARVPTGRRGFGIMMHSDHVRLREIAGDVAGGTLKSTIAEVTDRAGLSAAIERNKTGHAPGKMVIKFTR